MSYGYFASPLLDSRLADATRKAELEVAAGSRPVGRTGGRTLWPRQLFRRRAARPAVRIPSPRPQVDLTEPAVPRSVDA